VIGLVRDKKATEARLAKDAITNVHILEGDLTDMQSLKLAAEKTEQILGSQGIDVFINNAGYISGTTHLKSLSD
jgi:NAD(P)-dependent dehydrogenase (short-subunit alcohol dehydrogenase family)